MPATAKRSCRCGCGQAPAATTRNRRATCAGCGASIRASRTEFALGLHPCRCGGLLEPDCLEDRLCVPGSYGEHAYGEWAAREAIRGVQSDNGRKGGRARAQTLKAQAARRRADREAGRVPVAAMPF